MFVKLIVFTKYFHKLPGSAQRSNFISTISQVILTALLIIVQLIGFLIWLFVVPPGTCHTYPIRDQVVLTCNAPNHHLNWVMMLH